MSEHQYLNLLKKVMEEGEYKLDRTGVGVKSIFGPQIEFDLTEGFPLLTTKKVNFRALAYELIWFLRGDTNIQYLLDHDVHIWDEWADVQGDLGPIYGKQWRSWEGPLHMPVDQIANLIRALNVSPDSRRMVVSAWHPTYLPDPDLEPCQQPPMGLQALPPCHCLFQFYVRTEEDEVGNTESFLDCKLYQRSGDIFLGVPFNIASYSLLTHILAHITGYTPGRFIHTFGDVHLYTNHTAQAREQLSRDVRPLPSLNIDGALEHINDLDYNHLRLSGYNPHPFIKASVAI